MLIPCHTVWVTPPSSFPGSLHMLIFPWSPLNFGSALTCSSSPLSRLSWVLTACFYSCLRYGSFCWVFISSHFLHKCDRSWVPSLRLLKGGLSGSARERHQVFTTGHHHPTPGWDFYISWWKCNVRHRISRYDSIHLCWVDSFLCSQRLCCALSDFDTVETLWIFRIGLIVF